MKLTEVKEKVFGKDKYVIQNDGETPEDTEKMVKVCQYLEPDYNSWSAFIDSDKEAIFFIHDTNDIVPIRFNTFNRPIILLSEIDMEEETEEQLYEKVKKVLETEHCFDFESDYWADEEICMFQEIVNATKIVLTSTKDNNQKQ